MKVFLTIVLCLIATLTDAQNFNLPRDRNLPQVVAALTTNSPDTAELVEGLEGPRPLCAEVNVNYNGYDIINTGPAPNFYGSPIPSVHSAELCGQLCNLVPDCKYWTITPLQGNCSLKSSKAGKQSTNGYRYVSGAKGCR